MEVLPWIYMLSPESIRLTAWDGDIYFIALLILKDALPQRDGDALQADRTGEGG